VASDPTPAAASLDRLMEQIASHAGDASISQALSSAVLAGRVVPLPGGGRTWERWQFLADVAAIDLSTARVLEAHLDAVAILAEAGCDALPPDSTWGVFAAESPRGRVVAVGDDVHGWTLTGRKPWCSLADRLSHALVTAHVEGGRRLFAVSLRQTEVRVVAGAWHARGLVDVSSGPIDLVEAVGTPVGDVDWYLRRPGFAYGGLGVAACWYGGAVGLARTVLEACRTRRPDQLALWHLGQIDLDLFAARTALREAARAVDGANASGPQGTMLALRVRSVVAAAAEDVLSHAGHALGPAPLSMDDAHARRAADLTLYVRQHHAERDVAAIGEALVGDDEQQVGGHSATGLSSQPGGSGWDPSVSTTPRA
jgi:alkylation response protein AidB-like acyl-CoA dehydrogenase